MLEEQKKETEENGDEDEDKPVGSNENTREQASKSDGNDEKPDINDVPMEENEVISFHTLALYTDLFWFMNLNLYRSD